MSVAATIHVQKVESKPTARGSVFKVFDTAGHDYATFDSGIGNVAMSFGGKDAAITYTEKTVEKDGRTYTNRYLDSIEAAPEASPITARTVEGGTDWDKIGLQKTRCALWAAFLGGPLAASLGREEAFNVGRFLVECAEFDIFTRSAPNPGEDPSLPF